MGNSELSEKQGTVISPRPFEKFAEYARNRAQVEAQIVAEELGANQLDKVLTATTPEELEAAMEMANLVALKDLENDTEIQINEFHLSPGNRSEFANRLGVFAVIDATLLETGQPVTLDTGVERIIAYLRMCESNGWFPRQCRVSKTPTGNGELITLLPIRKRVVNGNGNGNGATQ